MPLVVTSLVAVVRLGLKNTDAKIFPQWKTDIIPESNGINFPDVTIAFSNPTSLANPTFPTTFVCSQRGALAVIASCPENSNRLQCQVAKLSAFQASQSEVGQNHVICNVSISATLPVNQEVQVSMTQGYVWFPNPPIYINPNQMVEVDFFRQIFLPIERGPVSEWGAQRSYESSNYNSNPAGTFIMSIKFRIPFRAVIVYRQFIAFDDWQLLASWGGFFTFMAFLHSIVFFVVKRFTPADSKMLGDSGATGGPAYEAIK